MASEPSSFWVFGYGSLIWRPGFVFERAERALLRGVHRRLCIYSHLHRGTEDRPGLVFGLMRGGSCHGMAFEVAAPKWEGVLHYLHEREQTSGVYREARRKVLLNDGRRIEALAFMVNEDHAQFAGRLELGEQVTLIRGASGSMGANTDYVVNTLKHLNEIGIRDPYLEALGAELDI